MRGTLLWAMIAVGCSSVNPPNITQPLCTRVEIVALTAGDDECILLEDQNGLTLFKLDTSTSCGGPPCLRLDPGRTGYVLEKMRPGPDAQWNETRGACDVVPHCDEADPVAANSD